MDPGGGANFSTFTSSAESFQSHKLMSSGRAVSHFRCVSVLVIHDLGEGVRTVYGGSGLIITGVRSKDE